MLDDILDNPAFYILAGIGVSAEVIGFILASKSESLPAFPLWQFLILVAGTIVISAVIASRD